MSVLRYWAGARAAAGTSSEEVDAATLGEALDRVRAGRDARFAQVLGVCSFVVDGDPVGSRDPAGVALGPGAVVDVLPPFAGG
ncbi:MAG TPA: MoaD/ThiS family protein [Mycobacteriales bacterium]|nr:MoaD/ThiS family protein [Mycobacteriales bacterium]